MRFKQEVTSCRVCVCAGIDVDIDVEHKGQKTKVTPPSQSGGAEGASSEGSKVSSEGASSEGSKVS